MKHICVLPISIWWTACKYNIMVPIHGCSWQNMQTGLSGWTMSDICSQTAYTMYTLLWFGALWAPEDVEGLIEVAMAGPRTWRPIAVSRYCSIGWLKPKRVVLAIRPTFGQCFGKVFYFGTKFNLYTLLKDTEINIGSLTMEIMGHSVSTTITMGTR